MKSPKGLARVVYNLLAHSWATSLSDAWLSLKYSLATRSQASDSGQAESNQPRITLIIPVYNVERYIKLCLKSVAAQNYKNLHVIVVNDGSTDKSMQIVDAFAGKLNLQIVNQANAGLAAARNAGVDAIDRTDYLMFLDSDDALRLGALKALVGQLQKSGSDFVVGDCTRMKGVTRVKRVDTRQVYAKGTRSAITFAQHPAVIRDVTAWNKLFRYDFYQWARLRFPSGVYFEDMAVMTRAYIEAEHFDVLARSVYLWRVRTEGAKSITQQSKSDKQFDDRFDALVEMRATIQAAIDAGKASKANMDAFADRLRTHDAHLHSDRLKELMALVD
jgi:CDP-glycerol glycerophosphotransferase